MKRKHGSIKFKIHLKSMLIFSLFWKELKVMIEIKTLHYWKYKSHIPFSFAYKVLCIDDKLSKPVFFKDEKMQSIGLLKQFLKKWVIAKKTIKNCFNKNLLISAEEKDRFQSSNKC